MRIVQCDGQERMGILAASLVRNELVQKPNLLLCAATGASPLPVYEQLAKEAADDTALFQNMRLIPLDEWVGLPTAAGSCDAYLRKSVVGPLHLSEERYYGFNPKASDLEQECLRIQHLLKTIGPIDICILGLGRNGHLGFNEPTDTLQSHCHVTDLSPESQQHSMIARASTKPAQGLSLGMQEIIAARRIIIIVSGPGKEQAKQAFFSKKVSPHCPATFLWRHNNVDCLVLNEKS